MIERKDLTAESFYWAKRIPTPEDEPLELVQVSSIFGASREYWSVAMLGTDQHFSLTDFLFIAEVERPS